MQTTSLYLLRHGQCQGGQILRGATDVALTAAGQDLMLQRVDTLISQLSAQSKQLDLCLSSPKQRCVSVAKQLQRRHGLSYQCRPALAEIDFGDWDGKLLTDLYQQQASLMQEYWQNPWQNTPPNGETMADFECRVKQEIGLIAEQYRGQQLLLLTHGGVIRHLIATALGVRQANGVYTQLDVPYGALVQVSLIHDDDGKMYYRLHWPA
ncbi:histidine phosphatase family protein [Shewanella waksmanii]|uniref:histidine phosphatase family protein n=1 Tax=Shewanella waksmanii TaxID=213783 RepID=UPI003736D0B5